MSERAAIERAMKLAERAARFRRSLEALEPALEEDVRAISEALQSELERAGAQGGRWELQRVGRPREKATKRRTRQPSKTRSKTPNYERVELANNYSWVQKGNE